MKKIKLYCPECKIIFEVWYRTDHNELCKNVKFQIAREYRNRPGVYHPTPENYNPPDWFNAQQRQLEEKRSKELKRIYP